jgi:hypothetical protein
MALEGEHLDDWQLAIQRREARLREMLALHVDRFVDLSTENPVAADFLRGELYEEDEIAELQRRIQWHDDTFRSHEITGAED